VSPLPPIVHVLAIAAGVWVGLVAMDAIAPDFPDPDTEPGVAAAEPATVDPGSSDSLFRTENLAPALSQLSEQLGADGELVRLRIEPGSLQSTEGDGGFAVSDVPASGPTELAARISQKRRQVRGVEDLQFVELVQTKDGPEWYVQLISTRPDLPPPWTYGARLDPSKLTVGGAPPKRIGP
jgi:hypothetical protein